MNPHNLTPELVALIERDATERYGHRMRLVLDEDPAPDPDPEPVQRQPAAPKKLKAPPKAVKPTPRAKPQPDPQELAQEIYNRVTRGSIQAHEISDLIPSAEQRTSVLNRMIERGMIEKRGNGRATRYYAATADEPVDEQPVDESEAEDHEEKGGRG